MSAAAAAEQMRTFVIKALDARARFYKAIEEGGKDFEQHPDKYLSKGDAEYRASQSLVAKQAIGDNNWHMKQAMMFASVSIAYSVAGMVRQQIRTNQLLEQLLKKQ